MTACFCFGQLSFFSRVAAAGAKKVPLCWAKADQFRQLPGSSWCLKQKLSPPIGSSSRAD